MVNVIYQDNDILVIDKPPGLVVEAAETVKQDSLSEILQKEFGIELPRGGIVHRLDKDTSGIILVAKSEEALENLQSQFKNRKVRKEYLALVHGWIQNGGIVDAVIIRNPGNREKFTTIGPAGSRTKDPAGRDAVTEYEPIKNLQFTIYNLNNESSRATLQTIFNDLNKIQMRKLERMNYNQFTLVRCLPKTGRTHQIRVHLKYISHPIVSDEKYGGRKIVRLDKRWCPRLFLHAKKIGFYHPGSGEWMELESELPEDLRKVLDLLRSLEQ